jgi:uncharacterized RDD family membrane protein YckC
MSAARTSIVLTPEHVPIKLVTAGLGTRFGALLIDFLIILALSTLVSIAGLALPDALRSSVVITASFLIGFGYHPFFEVRWEGRTPGKRAFGLRVMDDRGLPLSAQQALVRNVVRVADFLPAGYGLGSIFAFFDPLNRRLGDVVARTIVVDERGVLGQAPRLTAARRYNSLRTPRVRRLARHRIGLEERELLVTLCMRSDALNPQARFELMEAAAARYRRVLDIDDAHLSGEALVRDLTAVVTGTDAS